MAKRLAKAPPRENRSNRYPESLAKKSMQWIEASPSFWIRLGVLVVILVVLVVFGGRRMKEQALLADAAQKIASMDDPAALQILRDYEKAYGKTGLVEYMRAQAYRHLSDHERAKEQLEFARQLDFDQLTIEYENMLIDAQGGEMSIADRHFDELLQSDKMEASEVLGAFCYGNLIKMQFRKVGSLVAAWMQSDPENAMPYAFLGMLAQYNQDWPSARDAFDESLKRNASLSIALYGKAETLVKLNEYDQAVPLYREYLASGRKSVDAQRGLAGALLGSKQPEEALQLLKDLVASGEQDFEIRMLLGRTQFDLDQLEDAIKTLNPLRELWPDDVDLNYTLARAYSQSGQTALAEPLFAKTEEGRAMMKDFDIKARTASEDPSNAELRYELGRLLLNYSSREEGRVWLQGALQLKPDMIPALQEMEKYYARHGDAGLAGEIRQTIQRLNRSANATPGPNSNVPQTNNATNLPQGQKIPDGNRP